MAKPKKRKRKERAERLHREPIVRRVSELLASGQPTPWRWTSEARHGLRAGMCLDGMAWHAADARADEIVRLARHRIGLSRCPTWTEAQGDPIQERVFYFCSGCGGYTPEGNDQPWCSSNCRSADLHRRYAADRLDGDMARRHAIRAVFGGNLPEPPKFMDPRERLCRHCREPFTAKRANRYYCSNSCLSSARRLDVRDCLICATPFTAKTGDQKYCSAACAYESVLRAKRLPKPGERPCAICGEAYLPRHGQSYCVACRAEAQARRGRARRERQKQAPEMRVCEACEAPFPIAAYKARKLCGPTCVAEVKRRATNKLWAMRREREAAAALAAAEPLPAPEPAQHATQATASNIGAQ